MYNFSHKRTFMTKVTSEIDIRELERLNPWWIELHDQIPEFTQPRLNIYSQVWQRVIGNNLITALVGLRRVGKTTILKQIIGDLISSGRFGKYKILYFSFEEYVLRQQPEYLSQLIEYQLSKYPKQQLIFLLDEIQYVDYWNVILKKYWDLYPELLKFVISGSSGLFIRTHAHESLAGRILETQVFPASFGDFLQFKHGDTHAPTGLFQAVRFPNEVEIQSRFLEYLSYGEFPVLFKLPSEHDRREYLQSWVIGKIVEYDLPKYKRIIRGSKLKILTEALLHRPGQLIELQNLAQDIQLSRSTLETYLGLLEQTFLIHQVYNCESGFRTRKNRSRKIYPISVNSYTVDTGEFELGYAVETYVASYLRRRRLDFYFWRQRAGKEIDFVINDGSIALAIEVKYQNQIRDSDLKNLVYFCQKNQIYKAIVVSKYPIESKMLEGVEIKFIAAYNLL